MHCRDDTALEKDALRVRGNFSWGFTEVGENDNEKSVKTKKIEDLLTLRDIDLKITKGEFVCIIGDVGAGKSSLLKAIVGDLIYIGDDEIARQGGQQALLQEAELNDLKQRVLSPDYYADVAEKPIKLAGRLSLVEQNPWI